MIFRDGMTIGEAKLLVNLMAREAERISGQPVGECPMTQPEFYEFCLRLASAVGVQIHRAMPQAEGFNLIYNKLVSLGGRLPPADYMVESVHQEGGEI